MHLQRKLSIPVHQFKYTGLCVRQSELRFIRCPQDPGAPSVQGPVVVNRDDQDDDADSAHGDEEAPFLYHRLHCK